MSNPLSTSADYQSRFNSAFVWRLKQAFWSTIICVEQAQLALLVVSTAVEAISSSLRNPSYRWLSRAPHPI